MTALPVRQVSPAQALFEASIRIDLTALNAARNSIICEMSTFERVRK
jgi:hypothetical protein